jgi:hypothetical protein
MKKQITLLATCLATALTSAGQFKLSPELGLNVANYVLNNGRRDLNPSVRAGLRAGIVIEAQLSRRLTLQPGILYSGDGCTVQFPAPLYTVDNEKIIVSTLIVPVYLIYHLGNTTRGLHFYAGAGGYFADHLDGMKYSWVTGHSAVEHAIGIGNDEYSDVKTLDAGGSLCAGVRHKKGFFTRIGYQHGFINLIPRPYQTEKMVSYNWTVTMGYFFATSAGNAPRRHTKSK